VEGEDQQNDTKDMASEQKESENDQALQPCGTHASNNITFTEEISPIAPHRENQQQKQSNYEEFEFLTKFKSNNKKKLVEKENKLSVLLNEYKDRIDQNKRLLKSSSSQDLGKISLSTANSAKPPIGKQFEKYEKNVVAILNETKQHSKHNFNSAYKEREQDYKEGNMSLKTDEESLKNTR
jgi:hypothetical protein